jgi:hypothetical protein
LERMGGCQPRGQGPPFGAADAQGIADPRDHAPVLAS